MTVLQADMAQIREALNILFEPGEVRELRGFPKGTSSGYYDAPDLMASAARDLSSSAPGTYVTLNPVEPDLLARSANHLTSYAKVTTTDAQTTRRRWMLVDLDPVRPSGISSTEEEHEAAYRRAIQVCQRLTGWGWPAPVIIDSGNGAHLWYKVDLPNDERSTKIIQGCLQALEVLNGDETIAVDTTVHNPARITKLPGTRVAKGDDTPERPHRLSKLLHVPPTIEVVPDALLRDAELRAPESPKPSGRGKKGPPLVLADYLREHNIQVVRQKSWRDGPLYVLAKCVWNPDHAEDGSSWVGQLGSGALVAGCHHNSCAGLGWAQFRATLEPDRLPDQGGDDDSGGLQPAKIAAAIMAAGHRFATARDGALYMYSSGKYVDGVAPLRKMLIGVLDKAWEPRLANAIVRYFKDASPPLWECPPVDIINVKNGLLHWRTGNLMPHSPDYLSPVQLAVEYNPNATCPGIDKFIRDVVPEDAVSTIYEWAGLSAIPVIEWQKALLLVGNGANGKSTMLNIIAAMLGSENISTVSLHQLAGDRFAPADLYGKLVNIVADLPLNRLDDVSVFKNITGDDPGLRLERKYEHAKNFKPFSRLLFSCNEIPESPDKSEAYLRRWHVLRFPRKFKVDKNFAAQLTTPEELSGLLNAGLAAYAQVEARGEFSWSATLEAGAREMLEKNQPIALFLEECTINGDDAQVDKSTLYGEYAQWMKENGSRPVSARKFNPYIAKDYPLKIVHGRPVWSGIAISPSRPPGPWQKTND